MQQELFSTHLSAFNQHQISLSLNALVEWGRAEPFPHIKSAIVDYFNQLKTLLEEDETHDRQQPTEDNI